MPLEFFEQDYTFQQIDDMLDLEWDSEQFILPGGVVANLMQTDTVTYNLGSVSVSGPARDAEIIMVAMRAFVTVRVFNMGVEGEAIPTYYLMHDLQEDGYSIRLSEDDTVRGE